MCGESLSHMEYKSSLTTESLRVQQTIKEAIGCKASRSLMGEAISVTLKKNLKHRKCNRSMKSPNLIIS